MDETKEQLIYLARIESLAEEILVDRQEMVKLDERRNNLRVAAREIRNSTENKFWIQIGASLVKSEKNRALDILQKDTDLINTEVENLQKSIKAKVNQLRELEHASPLTGLMLNPLSNKEMSVLKKNLV
ncbi:p53 and DNA damage-regulated protein 1-like [Ctenocephalides felis]|uniref:p53 and DNA damage-regulated protein 1-like n=1 Tax=Ctenocephalides felis TaxID=7515 RepID=UPI000E6E4BA5|nr:p53 and DNA damage-regulated protein 1-like [Ctenocephalides felis]XP_026462622.1 p53 and DNA damage-regulated protein 1-like [Ctenocephalides felis]